MPLRKERAGTAALLISALVVTSISASGAAAAPTKNDRKCLVVIAKAEIRFAHKKLKALHRCRETADPAASQCPNTKAQTTIDAALAGMRAKLEKVCVTPGKFSPGRALGYDGCPALVGCTADADPSPAAYIDCVVCAARVATDRMARVANAGACGNAKLDVGEQCDKGADNSDTVRGACDTECRVPLCGNGTIESGVPGEPDEECEPGLTPTGCAASMQCVPAGLAKGCTCIPDACTVNPVPNTVTLKTQVASGICGCTSTSAGATGCGAQGSNLRDIDCGDLLIGGGLSATPIGRIPDGARLVTDVALCGGSELILGPLGPSAETSSKECSKGFAADGTSQCFFGPPLPLPNDIPAVSTCIVNTIRSDVTGSMDTSTGAETLAMQLASRVYLTSTQLDNDATTELEVCPVCVNGSGNPVTNGAGTCDFGKLDNPPNAGAACSSTNSQGLTVDCRPPEDFFVGTLAINLDPLTTGNATAHVADGVFCDFGRCSGGTRNGKPCDNLNDCPQGTCRPRCQGGSNAGAVCTSDEDCQLGTVAGLCGQRDTGAFNAGAAARSIMEIGTPATPPLAVGDEKPAKLGAVFCISVTGSASVDAVSNLPGPGATTLDVTLSLQ